MYLEVHVHYSFVNLKGSNQHRCAKFMESHEGQVMLERFYHSNQLSRVFGTRVRHRQSYNSWNSHVISGSSTVESPSYLITLDLLSHRQHHPDNELDGVRYLASSNKRLMTSHIALVSSDALW